VAHFGCFDGGSKCLLLHPPILVELSGNSFDLILDAIDRTPAHENFIAVLLVLGVDARPEKPSTKLAINPGILHLFPFVQPNQANILVFLEMHPFFKGNGLLKFIMRLFYMEFELKVIRGTLHTLQT
jgi:hypothetical protein